MTEKQPSAREDRRIILSEYTPQGSDSYDEQTEMFGAQPVMPSNHRSQYLTAPMLNTDSREHRDPARTALLIAIILVVISGTIFTVVAASIFQQASSSSSSSTGDSREASAYQTAPPQSLQVQGTIDANPTFAVPAGTPDNAVSSLPPKSGVPTFAVPTASSTPFSNGSFNLQVVSYPQQANNHSTVQVQVNTGQPHASVQLSAIYTLPPYLYQGRGQITNDNGEATIDWPINLSVPVIRHNRTITATARFIIQAQSPDGQAATSQSIAVQVFLRAGG